MDAPASARFHHGARRSTTRIRLANTRFCDLYFAPVGDPALGPVALSASRLGGGAPAGAALASLAGFHAHRRRSGDRRHLRTRKSAWKPADSTEPSRMRIAGTSTTAPSIPGPRGCRVFPTKNWMAQVSVGRLTQSGAAGARRRGPRHGIAPLHPAHARLELVHQPDLGPQSRDARRIAI